MNNTTTQTTIQIPSGLGMPTCGHELGATSGRSALSGLGFGYTAVLTAVLTAGDVRDRQSTDVRFADKAFPGSPAWRPPIT